MSKYLPFMLVAVVLLAMMLFTAYPLGMTPAYASQQDVPNTAAQTHYAGGSLIEYIENYSETFNVDGLDGMAGAIALATSSDGNSIYVAGRDDNAIVLFDRDAMTGELTFVDYYENNVDGVEGLDNVSALVVSLDGENLYAVGRYDDAVVAFKRDTMSGELTFVEAYEDPVDLYGASGLDVSPDGQNLYVTAGYGHKLAVFDRDSATGTLTMTQVLTDTGGELEGPFPVIVSPDGEFVYVGAGEAHAISAFDRDPATGLLTYLDKVENGVGGVFGIFGISGLGFSPDGNHLYGASFGDGLITPGAVTVFSVEVSGTLTFVQGLRDGINGIDGIGGALNVNVSPDGKHVYATGLLDNALAVFSRDADTGMLTTVEVLVDGVDGVEGLGLARASIISPDNNHVYALGRGDSAIVAFERDTTSGELTYIEKHQDALDGLTGAIALAISPGGNDLYVAGRDDDAIVHFSRHTGDGKLSFVGTYKNNQHHIHGLDDISALVVSPNGRHLYAVGRHDNAVVVFSRDYFSGALTFVEAHIDDENGIDGLYGASGLDISPDGKSVYVTGGYEHKIAAFSRNRNTGKLTLTQVLTDNVDGVDGLEGAFPVVVSPDNKHVYVGGGEEFAIAVFSRDASTSMLTFVEMEQQGTDGVDGLIGISGLAMSPDGSSLYGASFGDTLTQTIPGAVPVFSRDSDTGELTFVEVQIDGMNGVDGIGGALNVDVSPDGTHVFVTGLVDSAVAQFSRASARSAGAGSLTYEGMRQDGVDGVDGLLLARAVESSPDGQHVYVIGRGDNAVAAFNNPSAMTMGSQALVPQTGQEVCYDYETGEPIDCAGTGQDGDTAMGIELPTPRFITDTMGVVTDTLTGLVWLQDANCITTEYPDYDQHNTAADGIVTWQEALDFVAGINDSTYANCGAGYDDWRLPNVRELFSLVHQGYRNPALSNTAGTGQWTAGDPFYGASGGFYWSSTPTYAGSPFFSNTSFAVGFRSGIILDWDITAPEPVLPFVPFAVGRVWPVRGTSSAMSPAPVQETGQKTCHNSATGVSMDCTGTGQDGEYQAGIDRITPRFTDNGDGTITDNVTKLVWQQNANCIASDYPEFDTHNRAGDGVVSWQEALDFAAGVNDGTYASCGASYDDWRVPNTQEILSLVDYGYFAPALPNTAGTGQWKKGDPFINVSALNYYWSSTPQYMPITSTNSFALSFFNGFMLDADKTGPSTTAFNPIATAQVWLVRGVTASPTIPGEDATYTLNITNNSDMTDTFNVVCDSAWPCNLELEKSTRESLSATLAPTLTIELSPDSSMPIHVMVTVPLDAEEGSSNRATVTATSENDPALTITDSFITVAGPAAPTAVELSTIDLQQDNRQEVPLVSWLVLGLLAAGWLVWRKQR